MHVSLAGFFTGLSLIVAIGAQNAYLLKLGLAKSYVGISVIICALSDAILIILGTAGMGALVSSHKSALRVIAGIGAAYLLYFAINSIRKIFKSEYLAVSNQEIRSRKKVVIAILGFTWLNPHVYLDTVLLVGTIGSHYGNQRWWFAIGAAMASVIWFTALGYGARLLSPLMSKPITWKILDIFIAVVMAIIATSLINTAFAK